MVFLKKSNLQYIVSVLFNFKIIHRRSKIDAKNLFLSLCGDLILFSKFLPILEKKFIYNFQVQSKLDAEKNFTVS